jgi:hypothetical protein
MERDEALRLLGAGPDGVREWRESGANRGLFLDLSTEVWHADLCNTLGYGRFRL